MNNIFDFYLDNIEKEADEHGICQDVIIRCMELMKICYTVDGLKIPDAVDFNLCGNRCAYMYVYGTCHSRQVIHALCEFWKECEGLFKKQWIKKLYPDFKVCAIGGGPGCDIIAVLYFLEKFNILPNGTNVHCITVDKYTEWQLSYYRCFDALRKYEIVSDAITPQFIENDLFGDFSDSLKEAIRNSDLITMNKFVSSVQANPKCREMLKKIVIEMKPGALLLFTDNSGGDIYKMMAEGIKECNMELIYGPECQTFKIDEKMEPKMFDDLYVQSFGINAKRNAKIVIAVWQKGVKSACSVMSPEQMED